MHKLSEIFDDLIAIGEQAASCQANYDFSNRQHKEDGSILTEVDLETQQSITRVILDWDPSMGILGEENCLRKEPTTENYTAVIDPIDGTDSFSQGMQTWAISIGIVHPVRGPVAGFVAAPRMGIYAVVDEDGQICIRGACVSKPECDATINQSSNLCVSSRVQQSLDIASFPGKVRSFGSAALHLLWPALYPGVIASMQDAGAFIWDIAGAMAITRAVGYECAYIDGETIDWQSLLIQPELDKAVLISTPSTTSGLQSMLKTDRLTV